MENAHLRMGKLKFVRQTRDGSPRCLYTWIAWLQRSRRSRAPPCRFTSCLCVAATRRWAPLRRRSRMSSVFRSAYRAGLVVRVPWQTPVMYRASLQIPDRKRPVRHLAAVSQTLFGTTLGADGQARRTILYDGAPDFVLHRLAVRFGLPALPDWAEWFGAELKRRGLVEELLGFNCSPVAIKGTKLRMLRILSTGIKRKLIAVPPQISASVLPVEAA